MEGIHKYALLHAIALVKQGRQGVVLLKLACGSPRAICGQSEGRLIVPVQLAKLSMRDKVDEGDQNEDRVRAKKVF